MRILGYNIKDGGVDERGDRLDDLVQVIRAASPDALCLSEGNGLEPVGRPGHPSDRFFLFEQALGMRGHVLPTPSGGNLAVFLRPGLSAVSVAGLGGLFYHGVLTVKLPRPDGRPLMLAVTHLHPFSATLRSAEAEHLAWHASHLEDKTHVLVAGDFNSTAACDARPNVSSGTVSVRLLSPDGLLDTAPVSLLERAGLVDVFRRLNPGEPGCTDPTPAHAKPGESGLRIDFMMAGPSLAGRLRSCSVLRDPPADRASDHFPMMLELDV